MQSRRTRFSLWVGKTHWRRKWQPTPVFLPGESHGQRGLDGRQSMGSQRVGRTERLILSLFFSFHNNKNIFNLPDLGCWVTTNNSSYCCKRLVHRKYLEMLWDWSVGGSRFRQNCKPKLTSFQRGSPAFNLITSSYHECQGHVDLSHNAKLIKEAQEQNTGWRGQVREGGEAEDSGSLSSPVRLT